MEEPNLCKVYINLVDYFTKLCVENGFRIIEIGAFPLFDADVLNKMKDDIRQKIAAFDKTYHLPSWEINVCSIHPAIRDAALTETKKQVELASHLGIAKFSMHPGCYAAMPDTYQLLEREVRDIARKSVSDIFEFCRERDLDLSIENLPFNEPFFRRPQEFEGFVSEGMGMLLDTAHSVTSGVDPVDFIKIFGNKISEVHLVDGFKHKRDIHYAIGTGEVKYVEVLDELEKANFDGPIILELKSQDDLFKTMAILKEKGYL